MSFLQSPRYRKFEENNQGDPYRGQPNRKFPWTLHTKASADHGGDLWNFEALCDNVIPNDVNQHCEIALRFEARCSLSPSTLHRMGYNPERLALFQEEATVLAVAQKMTLHTPLADLEKMSQALLEKFIFAIHKRYDDNNKRTSLEKNMEKFPISRFTTSS